MFKFGKVTCELCCAERVTAKIDDDVLSGDLNRVKSAPYSSSRTIVGAAGNCSRAGQQLIAVPKAVPATVPRRERN
jgi:hypothetical protein